MKKRYGFFFRERAKKKGLIDINILINRISFKINIIMALKNKKLIKNFKFWKSVCV